MQALILNSGLGSRMGALTENKHKSMVEIQEGLTLITYQLRTLSQMGITDIVMTTGHMKDQLIHHIRDEFSDKLNISFVNNPKYATTNYIYSIYLALQELKEDLFLFHGDLYFDKSVITDLMESEQSVVVVDTTLPLPEKDFKAEVQDGSIKKIATYINDERCIACQPLYKLTFEDWKTWAAAIGKFCEEGKTNVYAEEALNTILDQLPLKALDLQGKLCMEVDTQDDLMVLQTKIRKEGMKL
ncbi:MAG: phosphocholine cytidylyltransferase family protein [Epulopiscium sp.]|nr:phosphocholine cytidylyltransferase family protein [Candidatus Epulonipiscium sp.]